ncbi:unnamed protein product [Rotaria sp. Silwood2]|nr:unnamed protein product [Rotaria sp. Silwood2]
MLPKGVILLWACDPYDIPDGWTVCDGTQGTSDLRDKFVIGSGCFVTCIVYFILLFFCFQGSNANHGYGTTGGHAKVTPTITVQEHVLTTSEMPSHNHGDVTSIEDNTAIYYDIQGSYKDTKALTVDGRFFSTKRLN